VELRSDLVPLAYDAGFGRQVAFYLAPRREADRPPRRLWVLFGGIKSLALDWVRFLDQIPDQPALASRTGFLLVDIPGYGENVGEPRARSMLVSSVAAFEALASHLRVPASELERELGVLGHSLGSGTALQFTGEVEVDRVILVSPFTSASDLVGLRQRPLPTFLFNLVNTERYDNRRRLAELAAREPPPELVVFYGRDDRTTPAWMGRELAESYGARAAGHEIEEVGHAGMIDACLPRIFEAMFAPSDPYDP
jgi:pimeloyl-ACP methyl ester carboxylesterase